ncbi:hypothetical protein FSP39_016335 [Pinctada imbricata]|uniref:Uncharacterized protein n=1 Tax=Pinctada imbricata TaxID=66713 RepID=A0AA88Y0S6_PINIB|nr:hypothetical protein FSP39_016335 [Pinctada imbricata]
MDACFSCGLKEQLDFICLACNVLLHDRCIETHRKASSDKTHSVIPNFDLITQSSTVHKDPGPPLAHKVTVSGPGVKNGVLESYRAEIEIDTSGAGPGDLRVQITGPSGAKDDNFRVNMARDSANKFLVHCTYQPTMSGQYVTKITWSDVDVPGSPFSMNITS